MVLCDKNQHLFTSNPNSRNLKTKELRAKEDLRKDLISITLEVDNHTNKYEENSFFYPLYHVRYHARIQQRVLLNDIEILVDREIKISTNYVTFQDSQYLYTSDIKLPYFSHTQNVRKPQPYIFDAPKVVSML